MAKDIKDTLADIGACLADIRAIRASRTEDDRRLRGLPPEFPRLAYLHGVEVVVVDEPEPDEPEPDEPLAVILAFPRKRRAALPR